MASTVQVEVDGAVATVILDRPEVRNAFNAEMIADLTSTFAELARRDDILAVVLRGNGRTFSAGADAQWMRASLGFSREENIADAQRMSDMFGEVDSLPIPVICRVHGAALGGGMGLMAVCDIVVAAENTVFGFTEAKLGIIPAVISRFVLPKIGPSWARALYSTGERFEVDVARRIGLVHWSVPEERLDEVIEARINELRSSGPLAARAAKRLVRELIHLDDMGMRDLTARRIAEMRSAEEGQEGLRAFLDKRKPAWHPDG